MRLGPWEIALIVMVVIVLFGARKIPEIMKGFGTGIKEFKKGMHEGEGGTPTDSSSKSDSEKKES